MTTSRTGLLLVTFAFACGGTADGGTDGTTGSATGSSTATTTSGEATGDSGSSEGSETAGETGTTGDPLGDGEVCGADSDCVSGRCYQVPPLGGVCGECRDDSDCEMGGCSVPNPLAGRGSRCGTGMLGEGCMTDEVCMGELVCALIIEIPGSFEAMTCSECKEDTDCDGGMLCSPQYDLGALAGQRVCVEPGSLAEGDGCAHDGSGDEACASGHCATGRVMGLAELGVCSECDENGGCEPPLTCGDAAVDLGDEALVPATCEADTDGTGGGETGAGDTGTTG